MAIKIPVDKQSFDTTFKSITKNVDGLVSSFDALHKHENAASKSREANAKAFKDVTKEIHANFKSMGGLITRNTLGMLGLGLGIRGLISQAHGFNQEIKGWYNNFNKLSDASGDASGAVGKMFQTFSAKGSLAGLSTIQSTMMSINAQGLAVERMGDLPKIISNISVASGISSDALAGVSAGMMNLWNISQGGAEKLLDSLVGLQKGFNMTAGEIEGVANLTKDTLDKVAVYFKNAEVESIQFTKGLVSSIGVMRKFGVSAKTAGDFMSKLTDPDNLMEMQPLLAQLGVSIQDQMNMMEGENKDTYFDKIMTQLPVISDKLASINNPLARQQMAKSIGLPMEIAAHMAGKSREEIADLVKKYKNEKKQAEEKQKKTADEAAKFDDELKLLKMQAIMPLMQWLNKVGYGVFFKFLGAVAPVVNKILTTLTNILEGSGLNKFLTSMTELNVGSIITGLATGIVKAIGQAVGEAFSASGVVGKGIMLFLGGAFALKFYKNMKDIFTTVTSVFKIFKDTKLGASAVGATKKVAGTVAPKTVDFISTLLGKKKNIPTLAPTTLDPISESMKKAAEAVNKPYTKIGEMVSKVKDKIFSGTVTKGTLNSTKTIGAKAINIIGKAGVPITLATGGILGAYNTDKTFGKDQKTLANNDAYFKAFMKKGERTKDDKEILKAGQTTISETISSALAGAGSALTFGLADNKKLASGIQSTLFGKNLDVNETKEVQEFKNKTQAGLSDLIRMSDLADKQTSTLEKFTAGALAGAATGATAGAMGGATVGTIVPGVGNVVGGTIGGIAGGIGGAAWGGFLQKLIGESYEDALTIKFDKEKQATLDNTERLLKLQKEGKIKLSDEESKFLETQHKKLMDQKKTEFNFEDASNLRKLKSLKANEKMYGKLNEAQRKQLDAEIQALDKKKKPHSGLFSKWGQQVEDSTKNALFNSFGKETYTTLLSLWYFMKNFFVDLGSIFSHYWDVFCNYFSNAIIGFKIWWKETMPSAFGGGLNEESAEIIKLKKQITDNDAKIENTPAFRSWADAAKRAQKDADDYETKAQALFEQQRLAGLTSDERAQKLLEKQNQLTEMGLGFQKATAENTKKDDKPKAPSLVDSLMANNGLVSLYTV